jgi:hypothetical protein
MSLSIYNASRPLIIASIHFTLCFLLHYSRFGFTTARDLIEFASTRTNSDCTCSALTLIHYKITKYTLTELFSLQKDTKVYSTDLVYCVLREHIEHAEVPQMCGSLPKMLSGTTQSTRVIRKSEHLQVVDGLGD